MIACVNHKDKKAEFHCQFCELAFCGACIVQKEIGEARKIRIAICPLCERALTLIETYKEPPALREFFPQMLRNPLRDFGLVAIFLWGCVALIFRCPAVFGIGTRFMGYYEAGYFLYIPALLLPIVYFIVRVIGEGEFEKISDKVKNAAIVSLGSSAPQALMQFLGLFWPVFFLTYSMMLFQNPSIFFGISIIVFASLGAFLLPMSIMLMSMIGYQFSFLNIFQYPIALLFHIKLIWRDYLLFCMGALIAFSLYLGFRHLWIANFLDKSRISYLVYFLIDSALHAYIAMVFGQALGYLAFKNRFKFKWTVETLKKKEIIVRERSEPMVMPEPVKGQEAELDEMRAYARFQLDHGHYEEAIDIFKRILDKLPDDFEALRRLVTAAIPVQNREIIRDYGGKLGAHFVKQRAYNFLWDAYNDYQKIIPNYIFDPPLMFEMAHWLDEQGMSLESARALKGLAVNRPKDECAAKALYDCAQLLWKKCDKLENSEQIFKLIIEKYPGSEFAGKADVLIKELEVLKKKAKEKQEKEYLG